ncbi:MAG TPA: dihydrolipoamide acetyltransferase family protein [Candidatus Binataceae bacterium]
MAIEVAMPKFGLTMHEGTVQRYFKVVGESVTVGEPLYEVETEKVLYEVEAPSAGIVAAWLVEEGATVECGVAVAVLAEPGEDLAVVTGRYADRVSSNGASMAPERLVRERAARSASVSTPAESSRRAVSPVARRLAAEMGVDLEAIEGSGPGGRVTKEDVERAAKSPQSPTRSARPTAPAPSGGARTPLRGARKTIAERMHQSLRDSAQITITTEADVTAATELRARLKNEFDATYTDMLIHAASHALLRHPRVAARLEGAEIVTPAEINVGIAVALSEGLIVPVVRDAARKGLREIAIEAKALGEKARTGHLKLEDVTGGTFTITNLGTYGIDGFTPILNPGETGILGVGRIVEKPAIYRGEIARRAMMTLSLTFDHRVVDGAPAAEFLQTVIEFFNYGER